MCQKKPCVCAETSLLLWFTRLLHWLLFLSLRLFRFWHRPPVWLPHLLINILNGVLASSPSILILCLNDIMHLSVMMIPAGCLGEGLETHQSLLLAQLFFFFCCFFWLFVRLHAAAPWSLVKNHKCKVSFIPQTEPRLFRLNQTARFMSSWTGSLRPAVCSASSPKHSADHRVKTAERKPALLLLISTWGHSSLTVQFHQHNKQQTHGQKNGNDQVVGKWK